MISPSNLPDQNQKEVDLEGRLDNDNLLNSLDAFMDPQIAGQEEFVHQEHTFRLDEI